MIKLHNSKVPLMKTQSEVKKRLQKLKLRYLQQYISNHHSRGHENCKYNTLHSPKKLGWVPEEFELEISPRYTNSLVITGDKGVSVRLCMYGADNSDTWNGDVCDSDSVSQSCSLYCPKTNIEDAESEFNKLMSDDQYVLENYPDIAALQWVINSRIYTDKLGFFASIIYTLTCFFIRRRPIPDVTYAGASQHFLGHSEKDVA